MRIAIVCGALLWLAGCNDLPPDSVSGDDLGLTASAGKGGEANVDAGTADVPPNASSEATVNTPVAGHGAPGTVPCGGRDCDAEARACFAKGADAKTCDALYHDCLGQPASGGAPANDPATDCLIAAKECYGKGVDPAVCDALLKKCSTQPPLPGTEPANDPTFECQLKYKTCVADGVESEVCDSILKSCNLL